MRVLVVGAGVVGLTSAVRLLEAGHEVRVWTRDPPLGTTSAVAAALWYPYRAGPVDRVVRWGKRAYEVFLSLADTAPEAGVTVHEDLELLHAPAPAEDPWWRPCVEGFRRARPEELPAGYADGYVFRTTVIEMPVFLPWLVLRVEALGGQLEQREVASIPQALEASGADALVNATGLGARSLAGDLSVIPVRGEVLRVEKPATARLAADEDEVRGMAYVVPRSNDCILGGTAVENAWSLAPDPAEGARILERCARIVPELRGARVLGHAVGLRPARPEVRLEREEVHGRAVVHNYGHGGAGVTLSWGCADEVAALLGAAR